MKKLIKSLLPRGLLATIRNYRILSSGHGQWKTMRQQSCVDADNSPIPWYTYPAINYITQLDFSDKTIFEYGSGNSTRFWSGRCNRLVAVEDNRDWYNRIQPQLPADVEYRLEESQDGYVNAIRQGDEKYDVIIVDGSHRLDCARAALEKISDNGFIILDNSDWFERTSALLREADLIEVDMAGFGPINGYTWTTSFYFKRGVKLTPAHHHQPTHSIGSIAYTEDTKS